MWLKCTYVNNMIQSMPNYVNELKTMEIYPNMNFA